MTRARSRPASARVARTATRAASTSLLLVAALSATGCGGDGGNEVEIDGATAEREILRGLAEDVGIEPTDVRCPEEREGEPGRRVRCIGTAPAGDEFIIEVTLTEDGFDAVVPPQQFD